MEILNFIVENRPPKAAVLFISFSLCVLAGAAIVVFPIAVEGSPDSLRCAAYVLDCCICVGIIAQWVTGSRMFRESLKAPFEVYGGEGGGCA